MTSFTINSFVNTPMVLQDGESGRILTDGTLATSAAAAISGSGRFTISVAGEVTATGADAIRATQATSVTITVAEGGRISATGGGAIDLAASGAVIIHNSGTIDGDIIIANTGSGRVSIDCSGTVDGDILVTNDVTDDFDLRGGHVTGTVSGGNGNDDYTVDSAAIRLFEAEGGGTADRLFTTVSIVAPLNIEVVNLLGSGQISVTATDPDGVSLYGNTSRNTLTGGTGNDRLQSNFGGDRLVGGGGNDTYYANADDIIVEQVGAGSDTIRLPGGYLGVPTYTLPANVENLVNNATGSLTLIGNGLNNTMNSYPYTTADETYNGGGGTDTMSAYLGDDTYITDGGDTIIERAGEGTDTVQTSVTLTLGTHLENLTLTGLVSASGAGNRGNNLIIGNGGNNSLYGHGGTDTMTGGAGQDHFIFSASMRNANIDTVSDFNVASDTIRLSSNVFSALAEGPLSAGAFARGSTGQAADGTDRIIYEVWSGRLFYDSDGTGASPRGHFATLAPGLSLCVADFFVF